MEIVNIHDKNISEKALTVLSSGGIVIYPTETCYGVGVDATNSEAVSKILKYKKRPEGKAISIACSTSSMASDYVEINKTAENLYKQFTPGPVTIISKSKNKTDKRLESEKGTLGIRIPDYKFMLLLVTKFGKPITSTSANSSGKKTPYSIDDIFNNISEKQKNLIDLVIDAGELPHSSPSTVLDTTTEELRVYRSGDISLSRAGEGWGEVDKHITHSAEETIELGKKIMTDNLYKLSNNTIIFLLKGDLGAGKTHFVKGIAQALGIDRIIKSPTYTYVEEYGIQLKIKNEKLKMNKSALSNYGEGGMVVGGEVGATQNSKLKTHNFFYHLDAWRIENAQDLEALGIQSWLKPGNVLAIEWPDIVHQLKEDLLKSKIVKFIQVEFEVKLDERKIYIS